MRAAKLINTERTMTYSMETKLDILSNTNGSIYQWIKYVSERTTDESEPNKLFFRDGRLEAIGYKCTKPQCGCIGGWTEGDGQKYDFLIYINWEGVIESSHN